MEHAKQRTTGTRGKQDAPGVVIKEHNALEGWGVHYGWTTNRVGRDEAGATVKCGGSENTAFAG